MHKEPDLVTDLLIWMAYADSECPFLFTKVKPDLGPAHLKLHDAVKELDGDKVCNFSWILLKHVNSREPLYYQLHVENCVASTVLDGQSV